MIAGQWATVDQRNIETPLEFVNIGRIVRAVVIVRIVLAESLERTKELCRAS